MHHCFSVPVSTLCPLYLRHPGTKLTASMILERLEKEARTNVGLEIASSPPQQGMSDAAEVCGGRCVLCGLCLLLVAAPDALASPRIEWGFSGGSQSRMKGLGTVKFVDTPSMSTLHSDLSPMLCLYLPCRFEPEVSCPSLSSLRP